MSPEDAQSTLELRDVELAEHLAEWASALRCVAGRWRFRANAGRLGPHTLDQVIEMIAHLEAAARFLEPTFLPHGGGGSQETGSEDLLQSTEDRFRLLV